MGRSNIVNIEVSDNEVSPFATLSPRPDRINEDMETLKQMAVVLIFIQAILRTKSLCTPHQDTEYIEDSSSVERNMFLSPSDEGKVKISHPPLGEDKCA